MSDFECWCKLMRKYVSRTIDNSRKRQAAREKRLSALVKKTSIKVKKKGM